jgi:hypothetical protein
MNRRRSYSLIDFLSPESSLKTAGNLQTENRLRATRLELLGLGK